MPRGGQPPKKGWEDKFFDALEKGGLVFEALQIAGISKAYAYTKRKHDAEFRQRWLDTVERSTEILEQIAVRRAAEGSDTLMIFLLKARRPEVYRENVHHDHSHVVDGQVSVQLLNGHNPIEFDASKRREAAQLLLTGGQDVIDAEVVE